MDKIFYKEVIEWDVPNWSKALSFWSKYLNRCNYKDAQGLEVGGRNGGISLYLALKHNIQMLCTDYGGPTTAAREKHKLYGVDDKISYADVNVLSIPYPDNYFDIVVFKSLLGALNSASLKNKDNRIIAMREIYRVLKPGGALLFAENCKGSPLHQFFRKRFKSWGNKWHYVSSEEMQEFLKAYSKVEFRTFGFFGALVSKPVVKRFLMPLEWIAKKLLPDSAQYIMYGVAVK